MNRYLLYSRRRYEVSNRTRFHRLRQVTLGKCELYQHRFNGHGKRIATIPARLDKHYGFRFSIRQRIP